MLRAGSYRVETYPDGNTTLVAVTEGDLEISGSGINQTLHAGQAIKLEGTDQVRMDWISLPDRDDFDQWCAGRDGRFVNSNSRQYVSEYTPGYADLDQYGRWDNAPNMDAYGIRHKSRLTGRLIVTDAGSGLSRGAGPGWKKNRGALLHFTMVAGLLIGSRWGWVPGPVVTVRPVYAPALVAFVGGPSADVQVWFPLGPRDPYLPWYHHTDVYLRQVNVTNVRNNM